MLYVSTGCSVQKFAGDILKEFGQNGFHNIELSSGTKPYPDIERDVISCQKEYNLKLLVHNYFPPAEQSFVLNLASQNPQVLKESLDFCTRAIVFSGLVQSPFYSVHAGYCFDPKPESLGGRLSSPKYVSLEGAENQFVESIKYLAEIGKEHGVRILIENNVMAPFNFKGEKNSMFLGVTPNDLLRILSGIGTENAGLLLDLAHLYVSSETLGFCIQDALLKLAPQIEYIHLSHNDGTRDNNLKLTENGWYWDFLKTLDIEKIPVVLEVYHLDKNEMKQQIELIKNKCAENSQHKCLK